MIREQLLEVRREFNFHKREIYFIIDYLIDHPAILEHAMPASENLTKPYLLIQEALPQIVYENEQERIVEDIRMIWRLQKHFNQPFDLVIVNEAYQQMQEKTLNHLMQEINQAIDQQDERLFNELTEKIHKLI
ncbi:MULTISPECIES: IDEAL domain-containing protein [unclassified Enterococcus]|uniref:IDEAL domain-containing protein n=1 Tax=unclassified Enterococcus TaxID=2608891 RepID=UPI001552DA70|nr:MULTISPECIES: IDEAL domain-containing protein [unclassified Enterococcus]MBS7576295.1 IDEAL domain-containing protein [Enterococcus sp. MMGLQ5-2]MBS7583528.1 IDEAL domain-containing protein [Enterococcus sp. MMGLQ5-1]NPD11390.1 IDEAL domain-containing protein [Enterococcus sp. MMGLQ5-1]NPD36133.1 IDEAL domain-containing protein [Enterococcus sp. MMGLQ5-2]